MKISLPKDSPMRSKKFTYGVATASFQIEGDVKHRLPCIWDTFCATPNKIKDQSNGDIACEHVERWQQDIELIDSLAVDAYRFSISWPRVIRQDGSLNPAGVEFYMNLLDRLNEKNIKPFVTLYHWDLPQHLEDKGGWLNRETAYRFRDYVDLITKAFGDRAYSYATLNEPFCSAYLGYEMGIHAPGKAGKEFGKKAAHHLLLAHGLAMQVLEKNAPNSKNGIVLNFTPAYAESESSENKIAARLADDHYNQWFIKPLFDSAYPDLIESLPENEKPHIEEGDMQIIAQPLDFLGVNFYTRTVYRNDGNGSFEEVSQAEAPKTDMGWEIYPNALTELLVSLNQKYALPEIYITENGSAMDDKIVNNEIIDTGRFDYLQSHLAAVDSAISQGVNIKGYFAWSLMDNFEWAEGFVKRFGIVYVDYATQKRTIKNSGLAYREFIGQR